MVHDLNELENDRFFEDIIRMSLATNPNVEPSVNWTEGVAFSVFSMPDTPEVVKEKLGGVIHYAAVNYTKLEFKARYDLKISNQEYHCILRKANSNPIFVELVAWIKSNPQTHVKDPVEVKRSHEDSGFSAEGIS